MIWRSAAGEPDRLEIATLGAREALFVRWQTPATNIHAPRNFVRPRNLRPSVGLRRSFHVC
jgi:hypothetical protein